VGLLTKQLGFKSGKKIKSWQGVARRPLHEGKNSGIPWKTKKRGRKGGGKLKEGSGKTDTEECLSCMGEEKGRSECSKPKVFEKG